MTSYGARAGRLVGIAVLVLLFTASAANAWGKDGCVSFQATAQGSFLFTSSLPNGGWVVDAYFTIGDAQPLHATIVYDADTILPKKTTRNTFLGAEKGVVTVDGGGTFDLVSHFTAPHQAFTTEVFKLNESGTISNGTGRFANISGHFTDHGIYGPAVTATDPSAVMGSITDMQGNICGVDLSH
jgi:hypothetical protein